MVVLELDDATFDEVVGAGEVPVLVEFTAAWCGPCRTFAPVLADVASEQRGRLVVTSVDADEHPRLQERYGVMGLPTVLVFVDGQERRRIVGARGKQRLLGELAEFL